MTYSLTTLDTALFIRLAKDANDWCGQPILDVTTQERGNLTSLKKHGLLTTFKSDGHDWVDFTDAGREYALTLGIEI